METANVSDLDIYVMEIKTARMDRMNQTANQVDHLFFYALVLHTSDTIE